ncbi:hypothetical protein BJY01DRAFT_249977 [Aspergillus pseudoustus]|uniref:Ketoreductase domain-containing protein n=1 Tax=Aspergillus pseudoustus TaxID=1810923 RepID=A0ABR4JKG7_9EURO
MAAPDRNMFVKLTAFTKKNYRDVYAAIDPTKPELSQVGKVVVITGATRGLGQLAFAASFARASAKAIALLGRSADALAETEKIIKGINATTEVHSIVVDVVDEVAVARAFDEIESRFGIPHVLINNAGVLGPLAPTADTDVASWWKTQEVNVKGTLLPTKAFLSKTGPNPSSPTAIINMTSGGAVSVPPMMSAYSISKLAVTKFTSYLQSEHPTITSVTLNPGTVPTDMAHSVPFLAPFTGDTYELVGGAAVWIASGDRAFLSGRVFSANWDVEELEARKQEIVDKNLLTISYRGDFGGADVVVE